MTKEQVTSQEDIDADAHSFAAMVQLGILSAEGSLTQDQVNAHINLYSQLTHLKNALIKEDDAKEALATFAGMKNQDNDPILAQAFAQRRESAQSALQQLEMEKASLAAQAVRTLPDFELDGFLSEKLAITEFLNARDITCDVTPLDRATLKELKETSGLDNAILHLQHCRLAPDDVAEPMPVVVPYPEEKASVQVPGVRA